MRTESRSPYPAEVVGAEDKPGTLTVVFSGIESSTETVTFSDHSSGYPMPWSQTGW